MEIENAMMNRIQQSLFFTALATAVLFTGCSISKQGSGEDKKVSIDVPGASIHVDKSIKANDSGIPLYPGAKPAQSTGDEGSRAHVNLDMPFMKLQVVKMKYTSDDAPEKLLAFYRDKLGAYGTVVECKGDDDIEVGYNFSDNKSRDLNSPVDCGHVAAASKVKAGEITLKAGTQGNAHLVKVTPNGKNTSFSLVYIHVGDSKTDDDFGGKQPS